MNIDLIAGARPNFMKIAPLHRVLHGRGGAVRIVHTGQHYDGRMSAVFFEQLEIPAPDVNLGVGSAPHGAQTAAIMRGYEDLVLDEAPDVAVVVGDVNSTVACSLVATKLQIPVAHVEAGLRCGDRSMPEEINRIVTDAIADVLLATEESGVVNLRREGAAEEQIHLVGNVMIDTLIRVRDRARATRTARRLGLGSGGFALATFHRPENVDSPASARNVALVLRALARQVPVVFPVHPRTRARLEEFGLWTPLQGTADLQLLEPLGYLEFLGLMEDAAVVVTDSGGIQEETTFLGTPCLTARENTERPITITHGTNALVPLDPDTVADRVRDILEGNRPEGRMLPLWDGRAAERIADVLLR